MGTYYPEQIVAQLTRQALAGGESLLQIFRLAGDEREHARLLATQMQFSPGDTIIDAGCGTGALAGYLLDLEPTLKLHLLNISAAQFIYADKRFPQQEGDIESMPYADGFADGVILSYVLGHTDLVLAMAEAHRVLKPGGWLFLYDIAAAGPLQAEAAELGYNIRSVDELKYAVMAGGFKCDSYLTPGRDFISKGVRNCFAPVLLERVLRNVVPVCARFTRLPAKLTTALQFSGGKDSLACLYLWREKWDEILVLWCNSGAAYPETIAQMQRVAASVPHFLEVRGNQPAVIEQFGYPADVVPVLASGQAHLVHQRACAGPKIQSFIDCCARSLWAPMYEAVKALGITRVIRGQRNDEILTGPIRNGHMFDGIEYLLPIQEWSEAQVFAYLKEVGADLPAYYATERTSRDCWSCTAYRFESRERTENLTGEQREIVFERLEHIRAAIAEAGY